MMTDFMGAPRRQSKAHVEPTRKALELIRPFVPLFDDWHQRAAKAGATALAHAPSASERAQLALQLAALYAEVNTAYREFETAVADAPRHSRIDDLRAAFQRLLGTLEPWRTAA
jgi:hypothetical protein